MRELCSDRGLRYADLPCVLRAWNLGNMVISLPDQQKSVCQKFCAEFLQCDPSLRIGISRDFDPRQFPINGLRHPPEESMAGWYLWSGEDFSEAADFFAAIHVWHIHDRYPDLSKYLGLAPGWRFLVAPGYEDVWYDANLLNI